MELFSYKPEKKNSHAFRKTKNLGQFLAPGLKKRKTHPEKISYIFLISYILKELYYR